MSYEFSLSAREELTLLYSEEQLQRLSEQRVAADGSLEITTPSGVIRCAAQAFHTSAPFETADAAALPHAALPTHAPYQLNIETPAELIGDWSWPRAHTIQKTVDGWPKDVTEFPRSRRSVVALARLNGRAVREVYHMDFPGDGMPGVSSQRREEPLPLVWEKRYGIPTAQASLTSREEWEDPSFDDRRPGGDEYKRHELHFGSHMIDHAQDLQDGVQFCDVILLACNESEPDAQSPTARNRYREDPTKRIVTDLEPIARFRFVLEEQ